MLLAFCRRPRSGVVHNAVESAGSGIFRNPSNLEEQGNGEEEAGDKKQFQSQWELHIAASYAHQYDENNEHHEEPVLLGFLCEPNLPLRFSRLLDADVLGLVLDLDEALVQSATPDSIAQRLSSVNERVKRADVGSQEIVKLKTQRDWLSGDRQVLEEFRQHNCVTFTPNKPSAVAEHEPTDDLHERYVVKVPQWAIRMPGIGKVFTRFNHNDPNTSFIVHVRRFINALRDAVTCAAPVASGNQATGKGNNQAAGANAPRFETYVCTASQPDYAMEVTRVIDPSNPCKLFCGENRSRRVVSVTHELKSLPLATMSRVPAQLTVIVDDRTQVWHPAVRDQVLVVPDFQPYDRADEEDSALYDVATELRKIRKKFLDKLYSEHTAALQQLGPLETLTAWPAPPSLADEVREANKRLHGLSEQNQELGDAQAQVVSATEAAATTNQQSGGGETSSQGSSAWQERTLKNKSRALRQRQLKQEQEEKDQQQGQDVKDKKGQEAEYAAAPGSHGGAEAEPDASSVSNGETVQHTAATSANGNESSKPMQPVQERPRKKRRRHQQQHPQPEDGEYQQSAGKDKPGVAIGGYASKPAGH